MLWRPRHPCKIPENVKKINILYAYGDRHDNELGRLMDGLRDFVGFDIGNISCKSAGPRNS